MVQVQVLVLVLLLQVLVLSILRRPTLLRLVLLHVWRITASGAETVTACARRAG